MGRRISAKSVLYQESVVDRIVTSFPVAHAHESTTIDDRVTVCVLSLTIETASNRLSFHGTFSTKS